MQTRDLVDNEGEDGGYDEGVCSDGDNVGDLLVDGFGGTSDGASSQAVVDTVKSDDVVCAEDSVQEETPHASDAVLSENIEGIINADPELDCTVVSMGAG